MTPWSAEQIAAAQQANLAIVLGLTNKAIEGFERLVQLNLQAMKSTLTETRENTQKALSAEDQQELLALQASMIPQIGEKALLYQRQLIEIGTATQAEFAKVAEAQYEAHSRRMQELVDNLANSTPAGSENAVGALTSVMTATNKFCEAMYQTTKQAVEVAEQSLGAASHAASKAGKQEVEHTSLAAKA
ncbi:MULTISPECIES: phasin family protein [unclassified Cupriavidus]|uniref:TIGR01841 family phasin n=1 Tax=unclassified Cupriavidus TaxID=2640874 RepID=UPI000E2F3CF8|nr:phasin family protein [Cupriavidus sp. P-10]